MEDLQAWIHIGQILNIKKTKFEMISKQSCKNIEEIQKNLIKIQENMSCLEIVTEELVEFYSNTIQILQRNLIKQSEFIPLKSLNLIVSVIKGKMRLRGTRINYARILNACKGLKRVLSNFLETSYKDIIYMALFEIDMIKEEIKEKCQCALFFN